MTSMNDRLAEATHVYVGTLACGCTVAACVDAGGKETAKSVGDMVRKGMTVDRVPLSHLQDGTVSLHRCTHKASSSKAVHA
jgi:hypothetical protein